MTSQLPILVILTPLFGALLVGAFGLCRRGFVYPIAIAFNILTSVLACLALTHVLNHGTFRYALAGWPPPFGIELICDPLSAFVTAVITIISTCVLIYGGPSIDAEMPERKMPFYSLALILEMGLVGMVLTGDLFNLYVFLEIASLAAYALMSIGNERAPLSALRYLYLGTIGGSFYLLGLGFIYVVTGSLNMINVMTLIQQQAFSPALMVSLILIVTGFAMKMALFPMHGWLPDAYTYASSTATALIAPLMTKVSAYALIRLIFFIYAAAPGTSTVVITDAIAWLSCIGIVMGSVMAMAQRDLKRMLAYSSIGQISYIGLGIGIATPLGLIGALLHLLNHAMMKACLFMAAGGVNLRNGKTDLEQLRGLGRRMPWTGACLTISCLAMVGIPPTVGFFSKWYLLQAALASQKWIFAAIILLSSLLSAVYLFRVIELLYLREPVGAGPRARPNQGHPQGGAPTTDEYNDVPWLMRIPMTALSIGILAVGFGSSWIVTHILSKVVGHV